MPGDRDHPNRVGDVEVMHGQAAVLLVVLGRWPGSAQLTPDQADQLAASLQQQAAYARQVDQPADGGTRVAGP